MAQHAEAVRRDAMPSKQGLIVVCSSRIPLVAPWRRSRTFAGKSLPRNAPVF